MSKHTRNVIAWYELLIKKARELTPEDRKELERWERENLGDGTTATSDWPGWAQHNLPPPPWWPPSRPWGIRQTSRSDGDTP